MSHQSPTIPPEYTCVLRGYEYLEMVLDLYGYNTRYGIEVCDVAHAGDKRSIGALVPDCDLKKMSEAAERAAKNAAAAERRDNVFDEFAHLMLEAA